MNTENSPVIPRGQIEREIANEIYKRVTARYDVEAVDLREKGITMPDVDRQLLWSNYNAKIQAEVDEWASREILDYRASKTARSGTDCAALERALELQELVETLSDRIGELECKLEDLESQIQENDEMQAHIEELASQVTELEYQLDDLKMQLDEKND